MLETSELTSVNISFKIVLLYYVHVFISLISNCVEKIDAHFYYRKVP